MEVVHYLFGHQGRHQGLRKGQDKRRSIGVGVTGAVSSTTTAQKSVASGRSFSSLSAPMCRKSTWTWSPVTSTKLPGANQMETTPNSPVFSRKHLPTQIFQCRPAPRRCGAAQYQVSGPMCVVLSNPPNSCDKRKVRLHEAFTIPRQTLGLRPRDQSCHEV